METMQRCGGCRRHVRARESTCPFCGGSVGLVMVWPARWVAIALVGTLAACTDRAVANSDGSADGSSDGTSAGTTMSSTTVGMTDATTGFDTGIVDTSSEAESGLSSVGFIYGDPETGEPPAIECDVWSQDCPDGEKCVPWANDGGDVWNATRCSPVQADPDLPGEPCQVEGSPFSGIDTCALGSFCWNVDPETLAGTCVAQCTGDVTNPVCPDGFTCAANDDSVLNLCLLACDPLAPACMDTEVCIPWEDAFLCAPDDSGGAGQHGDPCEAANACDPGLFCADGDSVPNCADPSCCTEFCDVTVAADQQCTGFAAGEECVPWFGDAPPPEGLENVGACLTP